MIFTAAVGIPGGLRERNNGTPTQGMVRAGLDFHFLSRDHYVAWVAALAAGDRSDLTESIRRMEVVDAAEAVQHLFEAGLLVELGASSSGSELSRVRLHLISVGLGRTAEGRFQLGTALQEPLIELEPELFGLVVMSNSSPSLSALCQAAAAQTSSSPDIIAARLLTAVPTLMRAGAVLLDAAA